MAIAEDATTPSVVRSTSASTGTSLATASFSPPASCLLVATYQSNLASRQAPQTFSISDTASGSWTQIAAAAPNTTGYPQVAVWVSYRASAPGSITVTAARSLSTGSSQTLAVRVLTGASSTQSGATLANFTEDGAGTAQSITTTGNGSLLYVSEAYANGATFTATADTTDIDRWHDASNASINAVGKSGIIASPASVSMGWTTTTQPTDQAYAAVEILSDGSGVSVRPAYVADRGTAANATAATTSAVTLTSPTSIAVGNYLIARVAVDNSGTNGAAPGCTVTDSRNTWTVLGPALSDPGAAAAGATAYLCYTRVVTAYQAADSLTFNWGGISTTAKAIVVEEWTNIDAVSPVAVTAVAANSVTAGSTTAVSVSITPTAPNQLVYTCLATEGIAGDAFTGDADTTNGTWSTLTTTASANATATNNQRVSGQYKVVTDAGAQTWNATITSRDWAALAVVFAPPDFPPPVTVIDQAAIVRSHYW